MDKLTNSMSFGFSTGKLLTQMQLNNIHSGKCNTSTYGSIWMCMGRCPREESDEGCAGKRNGETGAESETYKERVWFNLLSKPWNGIGVIRESKKYICASLPSTPLVFDAPESTIYTKTAPSPASLHCSSCRATFISPSDLLWNIWIKPIKNKKLLLSINYKR